MEGGRRGPRCAPPGQGRAPRSVANSEAGFDVGHFIGWRYISSGCSTGSHTTFHASPRSRVWTGLLWPRDMHAYNIYIPVEAPLSAGHSSKGPGRQPPLKGPRRTPSRAILHAILHASHRGLGPPGVPPGPTHGGARPPLHPFPSSSIPFPPRRLPSIHLLLPTGECSGPTGTGARAPGRLACHAVDGWTAWWPRSMQRRPLSGYRHAATSPRPGTL